MQRARGIVLERWTLRSLQVPSDPTPSASSSSTSPLNSTSSSSTFVRPERTSTRTQRHQPQNPYPSSSTSYKSGIVHFRSLYQYIRLLPAYQLYQRCKRGGKVGNDIRIGIKLWSAEGYEEEWVSETQEQSHHGDDEAGRHSPTYIRRSPEEGVSQAWKLMEHDLIGLDEPLSKHSSQIKSSLRNEGQDHDRTKEEQRIEYTFPTVALSHGLFSLSVEAREAVDFWSQDVESILSSALSGNDLDLKPDNQAVASLDLEEEFFTPTLTAKRRNSGLSSSPASNPAGGVTDLFAKLGGLEKERSTSGTTTPIPLEQARLGETGVAPPIEQRQGIVMDLPTRPGVAPQGGNRRVISESQVGSGVGVGLDALRIPGGRRLSGDMQSGSPGSSGASLLARGVADEMPPFAVSPVSVSGYNHGLTRGTGPVPVSVRTGPRSLGDRPRLPGLHGRVSISSQSF